jgi:hypothetical protein
MDFYPQQCGVRIPGNPSIPTPPGPQFCGQRLRGSVINRSNSAVTDVCGRPLPCVTTPRELLQAQCYSLSGFPEGATLPGFVRITVNGDCTASVGIIVDGDNDPIVGAIPEFCPGDSAVPVFPIPPA